MAIRNKDQIVDAENAIPTRAPDLALARIEREITNGVIRDHVDLTAALNSWEYRFIPEATRVLLRRRVDQLPPEDG